jgi:lon-related putative ATP-dependent protease
LVFSLRKNNQQEEPMPSELTPNELYKVCDPTSLACQSSAEVGTLGTIVGQERAVRALKFGLGIRDVGFNIYVSGRPGTGRTTAIRFYLEEIARQLPAPDDWCYINQFQDAYHPNALRLPAGKAVEFQKDMENLAREASQDIRAAFESEQYSGQKEGTLKSFQQQKQTILENINELANREGFLLQATPVGVVTIPMRDGKPLEESEFITLKQPEKEAILAKQQEVQTALEAALRQAKALDKEAVNAMQKLDREVALYTLSHPVSELVEKYKDLPEVVHFIEQVRDDMADNLAQFRPEGEEEEPGVPEAFKTARKSPQKKYSVNVLVDNSKLKGAPVVVETNPTYPNLFGKIEQEAQFGALVTDFTLIRQGVLHKANGGYLVLPVKELLSNPFAWESLKRALVNREIAIEDATEKLGFATKSLRPEAIPLNVKVILIGTPDIYPLLLEYDEQFNELFKVKADFDTSMSRTDEHAWEYASFVCTVCKTEGLKHLDSPALARIVEHGSRLVEDQTKLTTHFGELADVIREASYYATLENAELTTASHIRKAIEERYYRSSLVQERIREMIQRGVIKIEVSGEKVGQVNGLSVIQYGDVMFGQPNRITVSASMGKEGVVDIEREAKLGGPIHTKGVMILSGFLAEKFAQNKPLSLAARLVFEQSYSGVEGDSASSTELYALLSALSEAPVRQNLAVTGSVNQKGEVQAIGGVNEKIEGFFEVCQTIGLTGEQGVLIPESNVTNLMLKEEVVEAVRQGKFHIYPVRRIEEGIEILTGMPAGKRLEVGGFEAGSVFARVDERLKELAEKMAGFGRRENDK